MVKEKQEKMEKLSRKDQGRRFIEAAREAGADEDEEAFKKKLGRIAKAKPKAGGAPPEGH